MGYGDYRLPGLGNVGSYQIAGTPFLTGGAVNGTLTNNGEKCVVFPSVCRSFTIVNTGSQPLIVSFDSRANGDIISKCHFRELANQSGSWTFNVRASAVYISSIAAADGGGFQLSAELTCIEAKELTWPLSGSGINAD